VRGRGLGRAQLGATALRAGAAKGGDGGLKDENKVNELTRGRGRSHNCLIPVGL
jgi:hypothetical protein